MNRLPKLHTTILLYTDLLEIFNNQHFVNTIKRLNIFFVFIKQKRKSEEILLVLGCIVPWFQVKTHYYLGCWCYKIQIQSLLANDDDNVIVVVAFIKYTIHFVFL